MPKLDYLTKNERDRHRTSQAFRTRQPAHKTAGLNAWLRYHQSPSLLRRLREELSLAIPDGSLELRLIVNRKYGNTAVMKQFPLWRIDSHEPLIISYVPSRIVTSTAWPLTMRNVDFDGENAIEIGLQTPGVDFGQCQQVRATRKWENEDQELMFIPGDGVVPNRSYWVQKVKRPSLALLADSATIAEREVRLDQWTARRQENIKSNAQIPYESRKEHMQHLRSKMREAIEEFKRQAEEIQSSGAERDLAANYSFPPE